MRGCACSVGGCFSPRSASTFSVHRLRERCYWSEASRTGAAVWSCFSCWQHSSPLLCTGRAKRLSRLTSRTSLIGPPGAPTFNNSSPHRHSHICFSRFASCSLRMWRTDPWNSPWPFLLGPQMVRCDFRRDLAVMDVLKLLPLRGWQIAAGELLAPTAILTLVQWLLLIVLSVLASMGKSDPSLQGLPPYWLSWIAV